jgi:hypothetical protein
MAITIDGVDYDAQSPGEIALDIQTRINEYCAENNVLNSEGEVMQIDANITSIAWQILLAQGYSDSMLQQIMRSIAANFNFGECSDVQLLELARIARVKKRVASNTTVMVYIEADDEGGVHIESTNVSTVVTDTATLVFHPAYTVDIEAGESANIIFVSDKTGPYNVRENSITSFDIPVPHVRVMSSLAGVPGRKDETLAELRWRMETGRGSGSDLENAMAAIQQLPGVSFCNIFVNDSNVNNVTINDVRIGPRHAAIFVLGYSDNIAEEYFNYMTMETVPDAEPMTERTIVQDKVTKAGQHIPIYFIQPYVVDVYFQVYIDTAISDGILGQIEDAILEFNSAYGIGENIDQFDVINKLESKNFAYRVMGAYVSMDGSNWEVGSHIEGGSILRIQRENISVVDWNA